MIEGLWDYRLAHRALKAFIIELHIPLVLFFGFSVLVASGRRANGSLFYTPPYTALGVVCCCARVCPV
jgi:hypothetical protein